MVDLYDAGDKYGLVTPWLYISSLRDFAISLSLFYKNTSLSGLNYIDVTSVIVPVVRQDKGNKLVTGLRKEGKYKMVAEKMVTVDGLADRNGNHGEAVAWLRVTGLCGGFVPELQWIAATIAD